MLYIFAIIKRNHFEVIMRVRFIIANIFNILRYAIPLMLRHMCNLHISQNISKTKQGNQKLKDNLLCYFKCSFK